MAATTGTYNCIIPFPNYYPQSQQWQVGFYAPEPCVKVWFVDNGFLVEKDGKRYVEKDAKALTKYFEKAHAAR